MLIPASQDLLSIIISNDV